MQRKSLALAWDLSCAIWDSSRESHVTMSWFNRSRHDREECAMNILVVLIILLLLVGGGGFYVGGPLVGGSLGGIILLVLIILLVSGSLGRA
jgi:hypothetical protein